MEVPEVIELRRTCEELRKIKEQLEKSEQMYRFLTENSLDVIWQLDNHFQFSYVSPAANNIFGYQMEELIGRSLFSILTPESVQEVKNRYDERKALRGTAEKAERSSTYIVEALHKDGHHLWVEVTVNPLLNPGNQLMGYIGVTRDISERRRKEEVMYQYAFYDSLTKLPNRRLFDAVLERAISPIKQFDDSFAVMFLDVDDFKKVNDMYGHAAGDLVLQVMAERLRRTLRTKDFIARLAGDEFTAILSGSGDCNEAAFIASRLIEKCHQPIIVGENKVSVGVSIGLSFFPADTDNIVDLINYADKAMYKAKKSGGSIYYCYKQA